MKLIDENLAALRSGNPVRVPVPELSADVVLLLAATGEDLERVLEETLADVREKKGWAELARRAAGEWGKENPY